MASRRSRLQIKPNIGGPKGPTKPAPKGPTKPAPKGPDLKSAKVEKTEVTAAKVSGSPRKSVGNAPAVAQKGADQEKHKDNVGKTKVSEKKEETKQTDSSDVESSLSPRAGLRRFTKINPVNNKNGEKETEKVKNADPETVNIKETGKKNPPEADAMDNSGKSAAKNKENSVSENLHEQQQANMAKSTAIPRRSRFPKAKPNVVDASKKRQRSTTGPGPPTPDKGSGNKKDDKAMESPVKKKTVEYTKPAQEMVIVNSGDIITEKTIDIDDPMTGLEDDQNSANAFIPPKSPIKAPSAGFNFTASPIKYPHANVNRTRTMSTSEAPPPKKPRRTKIDLPTDKPPDRATMRMRDLIHWNPSSNPMKQKEKAEKKPSVTVIDSEKKNKEKDTNKKQAHDNADTVDKGTVDSTINKEEDDVDSALPVPQVTIGPDGNIVINEKSLVVKDNTVDSGPGPEDDVIDETDNMTTYASFRERPSFKKWTKKETTKFYKALAMIGLDFFMIQKVFPSRTRAEIKKKFKREEKVNSRLLEKVLKEGIHFDKTFLENEDKDDSSDEEMEKVKKGRKPKTEKGQRNPKTQKKGKGEGHVQSLVKDYFEPMSDGEDVADVEDPKNSGIDKNDVNWEPPNSKKDLSVKSGEAFRSTSKRRVVLARELKEREEASTADDTQELFQAIPLYPQARPSVVKIPIMNKSSTALAISSPPLQTITVANTLERFQTDIAVTAGGSNNSEQVSSNINAMQEPSTVTIHSDAVYTSPANPVSLNTNSLMSPSSQNQISILPQLTNNASTSSRVTPQINMSGVVSNSIVPQVNMGGVVPFNNQTVPAGSVGMPVGIPSLQNLPLSTENGEQYVLVTVIPEGSEETVIHIYRVPTNGTQPALVENNTQPVLVENNPQPALIENNTQPALVENNTQSALVENNTQPIGVENSTQPIGVENNTKHALVENNSKCSLVENNTHYTLVENNTQPAIVENNTQSALEENNTKPALVENNSKCALVENNTHHTLVENNTKPALVEDNSKCALVENNTQSFLVENNTHLAVVENNTQHTFVEINTKPALVENNTHYTLVENNTQPAIVENNTQSALE